MFYSRRWILVAAVFIAGVSATEGLAQEKVDSQRVPTPDFEVGNSYNYQSGKNSAGAYGIVHGVMMTTPKRTFPDGPGGLGGIDGPGFFPRELPREFGTLHPTHMGGRMLFGDNVALVGVLQQPGAKSKYMYIVLIDYGKGYHGMGFSWGGPASQPGHVSLIGEYFSAKETDTSANSPSTDPAPQESQGKTNKASRGNARSAQSRANARAAQTRQGGANVAGGLGGGGFGGGGFGGAGGIVGGNALSGSDTRNFRFKIAHEYEVQKSPFRLKNIELKLNEHEIKAGNPRVFLADYSGEKFKLTPVEVKFPEEAPDLQDTDQKTWAAAVKKTIDHLRENSSEVDQFMNKRTVQQMGGRGGQRRGQ